MARKPFERANTGEMFDDIAGNYDKVNNLMTFGLCNQWRSSVVYALGDARPRRILDVATGTAGLAIRMASSLPSVREIVGVDNSTEMLRIGTDRVLQAQLDKVIRLVPSDAAQLPFENDTFDAAVCAFGIRNFPHREQALREMLRVLQPGGRLCILELSIPRNPLLNLGYKAYAENFIPFLGKYVAKNEEAYRYLIKSIKAMPQYGHMAAVIQACGFEKVSFKPLTGGVATRFDAVKPMPIAQIEG